MKKEMLNLKNLLFRLAIVHKYQDCGRYFFQLVPWKIRINHDQSHYVIGTGYFGWQGKKKKI